ncbi:PfkB family carbohydrate kinase [Reyranella sp.]|uniref:PfkB family carbohydrate kinase n=1 Tax=Reyranella sp. TaxID=1929291 RepID=UPI003BABB2E6
MAGRVVVIGNAGLDLRLAVPRLPRPGETLIGSGSARAPGGKGLNQAVVAARCGVTVRFCAALGSGKSEADALEKYLTDEGIGTRILPRLSHPMDFSLVMVLPDGENAIVSTSACSLALPSAHAARALRGLGAGDVVLLQGNLSLETTEYILGVGRRLGATTVFNPAPFWPGAERLAGQASLVIANRLEAEALGPAIHEAPAAIVTLGAEGCVLVGPGEPRAFAAQRVATVDTTGCGDVFCGVVAAALAGRATVEDAIDAAQRAAALTATRPGAYEALPTRKELQAILLARA